MAPDCRGSLEVQQPRGEEDVLMILCLSGGGSRASWFSAASMLRLESVVDEINLLHEVDVISSASGGSLPAAYYCVSRDPGPYSVVRVEQPPAEIPAGLANSIKMDRRRGLLGVCGKLTPAQRDELLTLFANGHDRAAVERLYWLSHHTRAPRVWQARDLREAMTRNYIGLLAWDSFSPFNLADHLFYWTTAYDRSDQMAKIFSRKLYGTKLVYLPKNTPEATDLEFLGYLDRPPETAQTDAASSIRDEDVLRWPKTSETDGPVRLDWIPGQSPAPIVATDLTADGARKATAAYLPFVPYRFKDLNPERPYLILNAASGSEDDPDGLRFGDIFTFTREDFKRHLNSSIDDYDLAHAVMASAAFPGVFSFVTLRDFRANETNGGPRYLHVFDGGNADNLGLESAKRIILANRDRYRHFIVLLVDSHVSFGGARRTKADVRTRPVDTNFMESIGALLDRVRLQSLEEFKRGVLNGVDMNRQLTFWQVAFDDVRDPDLRARANRIPTDFRINAKNVDLLERCAADLIRPDSPRLQEILQVLRASPAHDRPLQAATPDPAPNVNR